LVSGVIVLRVVRLLTTYLRLQILCRNDGKGIGMDARQQEQKYSVNLECETMNMDSKYVGMTVNERLYVAGVLEKYETAIEEKNIPEVVEILKTVELTEGNIIPILKNHGLYELYILNRTIDK
jgi:hypothetical protein